MSEQPQAERPKLTWSDFKTFTAEDTDFAVKVQVSDSPRPIYSLEIGRMRDGKFQRFLRPDISTENGQVVLRPFNILALGRLMAQAEVLIYEKAQEREDAWQAQRRSREERSSAGNSKAPRSTGKTQRDRDKRHGGGRREDRDNDNA